jgi:hypothetical protein
MNNILLFLFLGISSVAMSSPPRDYYEIKVYRVESHAQEEKVEAFLKLAFLPAVHRAGIAKVGVFKPIQRDTALFGKRIYVLLVYSSIGRYLELNDVLQKDNQFQTAGRDFLKPPFDSPPYLRMESILLRAFERSPALHAPVLSGPLNERIYELRSYESPTEALFFNKLKMFNQGDEIGLFDRLGFNAVFYGEVLAGSRMPNLMYMTCFSTMASRDDHWKTFAGDPQWKQLSSMSEYQHNVSKAEIILLHPTDYSDL